MANFREGSYDSRKAGADLSASQYLVVKLDANGNAVLAAAATDAIHGVLANAPKLNETADMAVVNGTGTFKVKLGGIVAKDAFLTSDATGKAVAATQAIAGAQPTARVFGRALTAGVANDIIEYVKLAVII